MKRANLFAPYEIEKQEKYKLKMGKMNIEGLTYTNPAIFNKYFKGVKKSDNLYELNQSLIKGLRKVQNLDLIEKVSVNLDENDIGETLVLLQMLEKSRFFAKFGISATTNQEYEVNSSCGLRNIFGKGEKTEVNVSYYGKKFFSLSSSVNFKDFFGDESYVKNDVWAVRGIKGTDMSKRLSSIEFGSRVNQHHHFSYRLENRLIEGIDKDYDLRHDILEQNCILSFTHSFSRRFLDPSSSLEMYYRVQNSLNKPLIYSGNEVFLKTNIHYGFFFKLIHGIVGHIDTHFASILTRDAFIDYPERVYSNIRGFPVQKKRGRYALSLFASYAIPLNIINVFFKNLTIGSNNNNNNNNNNGKSKFPSPMIHAFVNGGSTFHQWSNSLGQIQLSAGLGIYLLLQQGKIEFNFCHPLTESEGEFNRFDVSFTTN